MHALGASHIQGIDLMIPLIRTLTSVTSLRFPTQGWGAGKGGGPSYMH